jgi:uncharacterized protein YqhQ
MITQFRDLRRVFEYHGAEHMAIHALEHDEELTPENVEKYRTMHLRCGTSFLLIVLVVSIVVFALVQWPAWYYLVLSRIVLVPLIAGISYEIIKFAGRRETKPHRAARSWRPASPSSGSRPSSPTADQVEVAIAALEKIVELEPQDAPGSKGVEVMA